MKLNKKNYIHLLILALVLFVFVGFVLLSGYKFGSMTDWISQHFRIPEYFRTLFYDTKEIFPDFAFNLGGGQNIYYLAYHGFLNPLVFISYLFPFIEMIDFMVIIHIISTLASVFILYCWMNKKFDSKVAFLTSFIFLLASPLIYHMHRHLMFINYMPFLLLALIGVEAYFKDGKKKLLIISTALIIFSSYFYCAGALIGIGLYGIQVYLKNNKFVFKKFIKDMLKFVLVLIIPIMISAVLILPTIYALINGRNSSSTSLNLISMLIPKIDSRTFLYRSYALGLTLFSIVAIIENIMNEKYRFLSISFIIILTIPICIYALNGFMYYDGKALIPFLPLFCLLIASSLKSLFENKVNISKLTIIFTITSIITILYSLKYDYFVALIVDAILVIISLLMFNKTKKQLILVAYIIFASCISFLIINATDKLVSNDYYQEIENKNEEQLMDIINKDNTFFRVNNLNNILANVDNVLNSDYYSTTIYSSTSNHYYTNFIRNVFKNEMYNKDYATLTASSNVLFNIYMGNKYLIADEGFSGYNLVKNGIYTNLYKNNDVFKIGYGTDKKMSLREFNSLEYPYTMDALLNYAIVDEDIDDVYTGNILEKNLGYTVFKDDDFEINIDEFISFDVKEKEEVTLKLTNPINEILILEFDMLYNGKDYNSTITINGITNALSFKGWKYHNHNNTFHYVISSNEEIDELKIVIEEGHYEIGNIKTFIMPYDAIKLIEHDDFIIDKDQTNGDNIVGTIDASEDEYFILNIPYDNGFKITVDNQEQSYELANTSFIGFNLKEGKHNIKITYEAPLKKEGLYISLFGVIILIIICLKERKKKYEKNQCNRSLL